MSMDSKIDFQNGINGDALLLQLLSYDFIARHGEIIGQIYTQKQFRKILCQMQNIFAAEV